MAKGCQLVREDREGEVWDDEAWDDYQKFQRTDKATAAKIDALIADIKKTPFTGLGKPEHLRWGDGYSRRISRKNRLTYNVVDGILYIYSCRQHYDDR
jgi:toxin YoeB